MYLLTYLLTYLDFENKRSKVNVKNALWNFQGHAFKRQGDHLEGAGELQCHRKYVMIMVLQGGGGHVR